MIYRITLRLIPDTRDVCIYAHPAWPFTMGDNGDPTDDYLVLFEPKSMLHKIVPKVFMRTRIDGRDGMLPGIYHRELSSPAIKLIEPITDLRMLG